MGFLYLNTTLIQRLDQTSYSNFSTFKKDNCLDTLCFSASISTPNAKEATTSRLVDRHGGETGLGVSPSGLGFIAQVHETVSRATGFACERRYILPCRIKHRYLCKTSPLTNSPCHSATAETRTNEGGGPANLNNDGVPPHPRPPQKTHAATFFVRLLCMPREGSPPGNLHGQTDTATSKKGVLLQRVRANS